MIPYFAYKNVNHALFTSIGVTVVILIAFGYIKTMIMGTIRKDAGFSAGQTLFIGVLAVGVSYGIDLPELPRLRNRQNAAREDRKEYPEEADDDPAKKEALREDVVAEEHRHGDEEIHEER
ncbi:Protein ccc1 [Elasticomyces elasticus]|nr:Protein ccc1 [Elasticomyces elasticus]